MSIKINILNATEKFTDVLDVLEFTCQKALVDIKKFIQLPKLDIVISPCSEEYKTPVGIMGCVTTPYLIDIMLDTDREDIINLINNELAAVMAHELHHVIRTASGIEEKTLFQILISEGLACHFETQFRVNKTSIFFDEVKRHEWRDLYNQMQAKLKDSDFNYPVYFGGKDTSKFPNRAGYWVGFNLVSEYIKKHGGSAATLVGIPAEKLVVT
jgi:uncharacterized protein YjaZ